MTTCGNFPDRRHVLYATSWVAIHYVTHKRSAEFAKYKEALAAGADAKRAWEEVFPDLRGADFDKTMQEYMFKFNFNFEEVKETLPAVTASIQHRQLSEADVLALRATLYWSAKGIRWEDQDWKRIRTDGQRLSAGCCLEEAIFALCIIRRP